MNLTVKNLTLLLITALLLPVFFVFVEPISQDQSYHLFSDNRTIFGLRNALNVLTNIPFLLVGIAGVYWLISRPDKKEHSQYFLFFIGITLISFGSGYYHLNPNNRTLVWDRLPMTIAFMSFFSAIISEHIHKKHGNLLLLPLVCCGIASVVYWHLTEQHGSGDLRAYVLVQFLPLVLIPLIIRLYVSSYTRSRDIYVVVLFYIAGKVFEVFDEEYYELLGWLSGHAIKHILSGLAAYWVLRMLRLREKKN